MQWKWLCVRWRKKGKSRRHAKDILTKFSMKIHHFESISRNSNCKIQFSNHSKHVNSKKVILYYNCKRIYSNIHRYSSNRNVSASFYMSKPEEKVEMRRKVNEKFYL